MVSSTALSDPNATLVVDTSTVINLITAGCADTILSVLPHRVVVVDVVLGELEMGRARGHLHADGLQRLSDAAFIEVVRLPDDSVGHFEDLVIGPAAETLDDGEAATIAYAATRMAVALIDERKAVRICGERFPALRIACTVDVMTHPNVEKALGSEGLAEAVFRALREGRMRVPPQHLEFVRTLIGPTRAAMCPSLPKSARSPASAPVR